MNEIVGLGQNDAKVILCTYGLGSDIHGIDCRRIRRIPGYTRTEAGFSPYKFIADILLFFLALKTVWFEKPAVIHGHLHEGGLISWAVKMTLFWRKISVVIDVQGSLAGELAAYGTFRRFSWILKFFRFLEEIILQLPDKIVCSSSSSREMVAGACGIGASRVELLGDVVPDAFFAARDRKASRAALGVPLGKKVIIYTGSLLPGKGVDLLLEGMRMILQSGTDLVFLIVGYPKEWVEQFVAKHRLQDKVILPGEVAYDLLAEWLATADLAVDPKVAGSGEASGKILHYMASGLGVVCFPTPNNRNFLGELGFYADAETAEALVRAIEAALADDAERERIGAAGRERVKDGFSLFTVGRRLKSIYEELVR